MANEVNIPFLLPVKMVPVNDMKYINNDTALFRELIKPFEYSVEYYQKWHPEMIIKLQIPTTYTPIKVEVVKCDGAVLASYAGSAIVNSAILPGWQVYEFNIVPPVTDSVYYLVLSVGQYNADPAFNTLVQFISEPQITIDNIRGMLVHEYAHSRNDFNIIFGNGAQFTFMCEGWFGKPTMKRVGSSFRTSRAGARNSSVVPFNEYPLTYGDGRGVPSWVAEKANRIYACDGVLINGRPYSVPVENEFEVRTADFYPMQGYIINVNDEVNRYSLISQNNATQSQYFFVAFNIETKAFGTMNGPASNNLIQITKIG